MDLPAFDPSNWVFVAGLVFARMGALVMLLPGIAESGVPPRIRLSFALAFSLAIGPVVASRLPAEPQAFSAFVALVIYEVLIGLIIGAAARFFLAVAAIAGQVIGYQTGLAMAQSFDPTQNSQGALPAAFLNIVFMLLLFSSNLHHMLLETAAHSYDLMPAGEAPMMQDAAEWALGLFTDCFRLGLQIASPLVVFGLIFYLGLGVLSKLMPQAQIFFIAMPLNILLGFAILAISLGSMSLVWMERFEHFAATLE